MPALRAFRSLAAGRLALAAQPRIGALLEALGVIDAHLDFDALGLDALFVEDAPARLRLPAPARLVCWFGARDAGFVRRLTVHVPGAIVAPPAGGDPVWAHLLRTVGDPPGAWREAVAVPAPLRDTGRDLLGRAGWDGARRLVVVHAGAGGAAKRWPVEAFARALRALGTGGDVAVALHEGPADAEPVAALRARLAFDTLALREPPLPALAGALTHAAAYLGNDSGISHLAAAVGVAALVLFTPPHRAWAPWSTSADLLTVDTAVVDPAQVDAVVTAVRARLG